ncbi:MAG TPA: DUF5076 domain-containing protein [Hyphomonadaceae bacterium]|nr:DUF5076 domain-containing protein [Hyphomonadaceae bacterium]
MKELKPPPEAYVDPKAFEIARIWAADRKQVVTFASELWEDPRYWGMMLVDLARHVARAYELNGKMDEGEALSLLRRGFEAEWVEQTTNIDGRLGDN